MSKSYTVRGASLNPFSNEKWTKEVYVDDNGKRHEHTGYGNTREEADRNAHSGRRK